MRSPSSRRRRGPARAAVVALTVAAVAGGLCASPALAASAAPAVADPVVHTVAGNRTITLAWNAVRGATGYTVRWLGRDHAVSATHVVIGSLPNGRRTAVRVTARGVSGSSTTVSATPAAGYPLAVSAVTATTGSGDSIHVHATGGGRATRIGVIAGGNSTTGTYHFRTSWYPATQRDFTVTVPSSLRPSLGHASGNPIYVKVVQSNALDPHAAMHLSSTPGEEYRVSSPPGTRAVAGLTDPAPDAAIAKLTVGEMNVQSISATAGFSSSDHWSARAPRVAKTMLAAHPDLILTAELSTSKLDASCTNHPSQGVWCPTQHTDLAGRLASGGGYVDAEPDSEQLVSDFVTRHPSLAGDVTFGTHIFYDPTKLSLDAHGVVSPEVDLKVSPWPSSYADRWLSWAELTIRSTGQRFLAVAVHLPADHSSAGTAARADEAAKLVTFADRTAAGVPIVAAGDFNADPINDPNPDMRVLIAHGYQDSSATAHRTNSRYATFDGHNGDDGADYGYPLTVHPYQYAATRIDFILVKGSPTTYRYENVLHFASGSTTRLDPAYRGSDHLMQVATVGIATSPGS